MVPGACLLLNVLWAPGLALLLRLAELARGARLAALARSAEFQATGFQAHDCRDPVRLPPAAVDVRGLEVVHVVYVSDAQCFGGLLASMLSLSRHLRAPEQAVIHVILPAAHVPLAERLVQCFSRAVGLPTAPTLRLHELRPNPLVEEHLTYGRFYVHEYLPDLSRVIYLDTDTIVRTDLAPLYRMQMRFALAAAPVAPFLVQRELCKAMCAEENVYQNLSSRTYFNAGVLVLDLQRWRTENTALALEAWLTRTGSFMRDQLALNLEFQGGYDLLDMRWNWNFVGGDPEPGVFIIDAERCLEEAWILHWSVAGVKPWQPGKERTPHYHLFAPWDFSDRCEALQAMAVQEPPRPSATAAAILNSP